jgi:hypothetical protein
VEFKEKESTQCEIDCSFYLAVVKHSSIEDDPHDDSIETEIPKMYLKVLTLIEFDTFVITHGPFTSVDGMLPSLYLYILECDLYILVFIDHMYFRKGKKIEHNSVVSKMNLVLL